MDGSALFRQWLETFDRKYAAKQSWEGGDSFVLYTRGEGDAITIREDEVDVMRLLCEMTERFKKDGWPEVKP